MSDTPGSAAGWRLDPANPTIYRYFDGSAWTEHTAPVAAPAATHPYAGMPLAVAAGPPRTLSILSMVFSLASILVAVLLSFFGLLMAIAGIVFGVLGARREPYAKPFWLTGIIVGGAVVLLAIAGIVLLIVIATSSPTFGI